MCVVTHARPQGLARLLEGLAGQRFRAAPAGFRVIVVDNAPRPDAEAVCAGFAGRFSAGLVYRRCARPGIASGRNAALEAAGDAEWIAFLDDDEVPDPGWLDALLQVARDTGAPVVTGPVLAAFESPPPHWVPAGGFFSTPRRPTGTLLLRAFTGNVLFRGALLRETGRRFDPRLDRTGGEDTHFFTALGRAGYPIVWADEAIVRETVPAERVDPRWLVRRKFRSGHTDAFVALDLAPGLGTRGRLAARGLAWLALGTLACPVGLVLGRHWRLRALRGLAYGAGLLRGVTGGVFEEYGRTPKPEGPG